MGTSTGEREATEEAHGDTRSTPAATAYAGPHTRHKQGWVCTVHSGHSTRGVATSLTPACVRRPHPAPGSVLCTVTTVTCTFVLVGSPAPHTPYQELCERLLHGSFAVVPEVTDPVVTWEW